MAKVLKHITAGLLHLEVLGRVPDQSAGGKRRGGRQSPTRLAQQFYNNKCSWRELELTIAANFSARDLVVTFTYDDAHLPADKPAADACFQKFIRRLRTARKKRGEPLLYIYTTEGFHEKRWDDLFGDDGALEDRRLHHHVVLNATPADDLEELRSLWPYGGSIRAEKLDVHYYRELAKYLTKEAREFGRPKPGQRTWKRSQNLRRYEVEYVEIPDSLTLAPPAGAVDYEQFSEKNPYGFADSMGARYLIFPEREQIYTYNRPRERKRPPNNFLT